MLASAALLLCVAVLISAEVHMEPEPVWYPVPMFNCPKLPKQPPATHIRNVRPQDVKAVMALGDSMSAGFAMHAGHIEDVLTLVEYRGDVFSAGGNDGQYTMPNFLKHYNPGLLGMSIGFTPPLDAIKWKNGLLQPFEPRITHLNAAQSQAKIGDLLKQVEYLHLQLTTTYNKTIDFHNDFKVLTILIGANNLCGACKGRDYAEPDYFEKTMDQILTQVNLTIPRVHVNIVSLFNISNVYPVAMQSSYCKLMWKDILKTECMCMQGDATDHDRLVMDERSLEFNLRLQKVAAKWQAFNLPGFNVVYQPFLEQLQVYGINYISKLDCFHPSYVADAAMAIGLWNSMLTPAAFKPHGFDIHNTTFVCPTVNTYIQ